MDDLWPDSAALISGIGNWANPWKRWGLANFFVPLMRLTKTVVLQERIFLQARPGNEAICRLGQPLTAIEEGGDIFNPNLLA